MCVSVCNGVCVCVCVCVEGSVWTAAANVRVVMVFAYV